MIPIFLSIKGLYSYKETQEIDFTALTSSGLFGIFGLVGSGKSSILEAIMFVLFYESDRLNTKNDNRYYNMLNLQSNELEIDFIFNAGPENSLKYRFRFVARRSKKDFDKVEVKERNHYQWQNGEWLPLENIKDASEILGMTYQNFMQTIIIPQGRFREFIDRSPTDRTKMLKELFHLDRFDLSQKTNAVLKKNELQIENLLGKLQGLGEVNEEEIEEKKKLLKEVEETLRTADLECQALKAEESKMRLLKNLFEQIWKMEAIWEDLEKKKDGFEIKENRLKIYETAYVFLKEKLKALNNLKSELIAKQNLHADLKLKANKNQEEIAEAERALNFAKEAFNNLDEIKLKCADLEKIIEIKKMQSSTMFLKGRVAQKKKELEESVDQLNALKATLSEDEKQISHLEASITDHSQIHEVYHWYLRLRDLEKEQAAHLENYRKHQKLWENLDARKKELSVDYDVSLPFEDLLLEIEENKKDYESKKGLVETGIQNLLVQQKMADLTLQLKDNEPCPVCGSLHHPAQSEVHSVEDRILKAEDEKRAWDQKLKNLTTLESQFKQIQIEIKNALELISEKENDLQSVKDRIESHRAGFIWHQFESEGFDAIDQKRLASASLQKQIAKTKEDFKVKKQKVLDFEERLEKVRKEVIKLDNESCSVEASYQTLLKQLKVLNYEKFEKYSNEQLQDSLKKGKVQLEEISRVYEEKTQSFQKLKESEQNLLGRMSSESSNIDELQTKLVQLESQIGEIITEKGFESIEEVNQILAEAIQIDKERKVLDDYHKEVHSTKTNLKNLYAEADGLVYEEEKHLELSQELEKIDDLIQKLKKEAALQQKEIEDLITRLQNKLEWEKERDRLLEREQNLKELRKMFMGNGFVRYVSSVYLQDLCKAANQRFFRLTNNSLSLELSKDEEFIVRDYLNNGKTRLLKTLSGGQTFQAALCLALALAENIKSLNKADKSFFFLDEGFGSLDKESLRVVFDTLKTLRKENRIVGIISHVEDLQQEIDLYLKVVNDKDRGSLVSYSWEAS